MSKTGLNRRQFIQSGARTVGAGVVASVGVSASGYAGPEATLDSEVLETLAVMSRRLYPHDRLGDTHYRTCVEGLEKKAGENPAISTQLIEGVRALDDASAPSRFTDLDAEDQTRILEAQRSTDFFETVRSHVVVALYKDERVWSKLGYEGASYPFGGYLERGFDDIDWLPEKS